MSKIVQLTASNVKRLSAVTITPDGSTVVIGGRHGNGKSSVLDCIVYAITGTKSLPPVPLRRGTNKGHIDLDLGELKIRRTFTRKGEADYTTSLEVKRANGDKVASPQALLDSLCSSLAFDPLEFARLKPKAQLEALKSLVNLDFTKLDQDRARIYAERTEVNRQQAAKKAEWMAIPHVADVGQKEVFVSELLKELRRRETVNKKNDAAREHAAELRESVAERKEEIADVKAQIEELQKRLARLTESLEIVAGKASDAALAADSLIDENIEEVQQQIANAERINGKIRSNIRREQLVREEQKLSDKSDDLTRQIDEIDDEKTAAMKAARFPVDGLGFGADGVLLNGLPLEQANTAAQIELSVAMGMALNPTLRVMLVRDGSSLFADETGLGLIAKLAEKHDAQVWIERASVGDECSVIIDDGHVAGDDPQVNELEAATA